MNSLTDVIALVAATAIGASQGAGTSHLRRVDGETVATSNVRIDPSGTCSFLGADGSLNELPLDQILDVRFANSSAAANFSSTAALHLHDGSRVLGQVVGGDEAELAFEFAGGPRVPFSIDAVSGVFLGDSFARREAADYRRSAEGDSLFRRREAGGDFTTGTLMKFGDRSVGFDFLGEERVFPLNEIEAVHLELQVDLPEDWNDSVVVDLWPDGNLAGELKEFNDEIVSLVPLFGEAPVELPRSIVRGIRFSRPEAVWLPSLQPVTVEQIPFVGGDDTFLFPYRRDRSVTGRPLQIGMRRYSQGIGCHARCRLEFEVPDGARRFVSDCGVADEVLELGHPGSVEFVVLVDGVEAFRSDMLRGGEAAQTVDLAVEGARRITLIADFGDDQDVADRGVWGDPLFLR